MLARPTLTKFLYYLLVIWGMLFLMGQVNAVLLQHGLMMGLYAMPIGLLLGGGLTIVLDSKWKAVGCSGLVGIAVCVSMLYLVFIRIVAQDARGIPAVPPADINHSLVLPIVSGLVVAIGTALSWRVIRWLESKRQARPPAVNTGE